MLLSVYVTSVLFLVLAGNFTQTMGFYWSCTLLVPFLCALVKSQPVTCIPLFYYTCRCWIWNVVFWVVYVIIIHHTFPNKVNNCMKVATVMWNIYTSVLNLSFPVRDHDQCIYSEFLTSSCRISMKHQNSWLPCSCRISMKHCITHLW